MTRPSSLLSSGLPPRFVQVVTHAFDALECTEPPMLALVDLLGALATAYGLSEPRPVQRIFSLLAAANHAHTRLSGPIPPFAMTAAISSLSTSEWLLLVARERAAASLPSSLGDAVDALIAQLDAVFAGGHTVHVAPPIVDYGLGEILGAIHENASDTGTFVSGFATKSAEGDSKPQMFKPGLALGKLTRLTLEVLLASRPSGPFLAPILLRSLTDRDPENASRLDLAVALACKAAPDKLPLVSYLGQARVRTRIAETVAVWSEEALGGFDGECLELVRTFVHNLGSAITAKANTLRLFGLAKAPSLVAELDRTIQLAVDALMDDPELRESWEVQRWGGPFPTTCIGKFFPMGLCTLALAEASVDPSTRVPQLLSMCGVDGFRYFEGFWGIAPDADDLGLALQLIARIPNGAAHVEVLAWPLEVLVRNTLPDGEIPVWLDRHLREPVVQEAIQWRGSRCLAVAANAVIGLLEARVPLPAGYLDRAIDWITRTWRADGLRAVFFYGLSYTRFVLVRLADVAEGRTEDPLIHQKLRDIARDIEEEIGASIEDDGGFGGIIDTACHLAALACGRQERFDPWPSIAFLASRQDHDGLWAAEPLYPTPGKDYAPGAHGARTITTALCLYSLARVRRRATS